MYIHNHSKFTLSHTQHYIYTVKFATEVELDKKAPFSIGTTPRCRRESTPPFPGLVHFTLEYDSTWDRTSVSPDIGERSTH